MLRFDWRDNVAIFSLVLLVVLTITELTFSYLGNRGYYKKADTLTNLYLTALAVCINLLVKGATFFLLQWVWQYRLFVISNPIVYWIVLIVLQDLLYWLLHYTGHYCRLFWAMHVTHHSSQEFNLTVGFRSTVFEPLYRVFFYLPLALMGFTAIDILLAYLATQLYGNLVHTRYQIKLPKWYGYIFVTPSQHSVHHGSNVAYLDKNMGMLLIIWDRLFGTYQSENLPEPTRYGLTKQPEDQGPINIIFHEWRAMIADVRKAPTLSTKLKYIFNPPGWSHDGSSKTTRELRIELRVKKQDKLAVPKKS
jgi:sterol desaturase/sphingolipid hydroxylase (fatty acid hydroxylase superfamily)